MQLYISIGFILFLYSVFVVAGIMFTGIGISLGINGDGGWNWRFALGVSMLIVAVLFLVTGILMNFVHITLI